MKLITYPIYFKCHTFSNYGLELESFLQNLPFLFVEEIWRKNINMRDPFLIFKSELKLSKRKYFLMHKTRGGLNSILCRESLNDTNFTPNFNTSVIALPLPCTIFVTHLDQPLKTTGYRKIVL